MIDEQWRKIRQVAMPSFLSYFNQGPLNYEEQTINWIRGLYGKLDEIVESECGLKSENFIQFYENIDALVQKKFQGFGTNNEVFRKEWLEYTKIKMGVVDEAPSEIKALEEERRPLMTFIADHGIILRFKKEDIASKDLSLEQVSKILSILTCKREVRDFKYYTSTKPGNPLYDKPIIDIGDGLYQVFEVKQIIHAIDDYLEAICSKTKEYTTRLIEGKGKLLEERILDLFIKFFKKDFKFYAGYFVEGFEQDILFLWKNYAFIIEAKGYNIREPFRDPNRAFTRIKDDFNSCIRYGYEQTNRVEQKFLNKFPLKIEDKNRKLIEEIDTSLYEDNDFSIIVNLNSFGQIQNDLSTLLELDDNNEYPWVVKFDDLEVFLLTLIAKNKKPEFFIDFLLFREKLHGKLFCFDELEVCGGFLTGSLNEKKIENSETILTTPDLASVFDQQYSKGIGFENEKYLFEKKSGKYVFM